VGAGIIDNKGFPFSCCKSTKDEILGGLYDSKSPSLLIAFTMEICVLPSISGSIINPLKSCFWKLVSNEFYDRHPMGGSPKGLGSSKIFLGVLLQIISGKNWLRNRYMVRYKFWLEYLEIRDFLW
jgi:hypothetical protein